MKILVAIATMIACLMLPAMAPAAAPEPTVLADKNAGKKKDGTTEQEKNSPRAAAPPYRMLL